MTRRHFLLGLAATTAMRSAPVWAQPAGKTARIGVLSPIQPLVENSGFGAALLNGLKLQGYYLGRNLLLEQRAAEGRLEKLPALASELASANVDLIVTFGYVAALAAKQSGRPTVVTHGAGDPVETGLVASLSKPGGNLTGISDDATSLSIKRLQLLKEFKPSLARVAMLWNGDDTAMNFRYEASARVAESLGVTVQGLAVREPHDFASAFEAMGREPPDAILMVADPLTTLNRKRVIEFAAVHRLPAIYEFDYFARDGGLMSFGPSLPECFERAAALAALVLKGANPADLPFERPSRYIFILNLNAAAAQGLAVPNALLVRADEVIE